MLANQFPFLEFRNWLLRNYWSYLMLTREVIGMKKQFYRKQLTYRERNKYNKCLKRSGGRLNVSRREEIRESSCYGSFRFSGHLPFAVKWRGDSVCWEISFYYWNKLYFFHLTLWLLLFGNNLWWKLNHLYRSVFLRTHGISWCLLKMSGPIVKANEED